MTKHYYTKKLDIPQDADSVRFPIPEGYTASIEDGVFVLVPKEDNDEKTRKELLEVIRHCYEDGGYTLCTDDYKKYSSYLEKQKTESQEQYSPLCNTVKDKIREYIANHFITDTVVKTDVKSIVKAMEEGVRLGREECRLEEWSEGDEKMLVAISKALGCDTAEKILVNEGVTLVMAAGFLESLKNRGNSPKSNTNSPSWSDGDTIHLTNAILAAEKEWGPGSCTAAWLKSLRDRWVYLSWKPSEEQMKAFDMVLTDESMDDNVRAVLTALKNKLQNQCKNG